MTAAFLLGRSFPRGMAAFLLPKSKTGHFRKNHKNDKYDGHCHVKVDIYFTGAGIIDVPTEKEILALMEEIRNEEDETKLFSA